jgi:hypothetical protein
MQKESSLEVFRIASDAWQQFMDREQLHSAVVTGISAYLSLREMEAGQLAEGALGLIHVAIDAITRIDGDQREKVACSFCGRGEPEVRLAAGPKAFICDSCVNDLSNVFADRKDT